MRYFLAILLFCTVVVSLSGQVRPNLFNEQLNPNNSNFEIYSQKNNVPRRTSVDSLGKNYRLKIYPFAADTVYAAGNASPMRNALVQDTSGRLYFIDFYGVSKQILSLTNESSGETFYFASGTLTSDRQVSGDNYIYNMTFTAIDTFKVYNTQWIDIGGYTDISNSSFVTYLYGLDEVRIKCPNGDMYIQPQGYLDAPIGAPLIKGNFDGSVFYAPFGFSGDIPDDGDGLVYNSSTLSYEPQPISGASSNIYTQSDTIADEDRDVSIMPERRLAFAYDSLGKFDVKNNRYNYYADTTLGGFSGGLFISDMATPEASGAAGSVLYFGTGPTTNEDNVSESYLRIDERVDIGSAGNINIETYPGKLTLGADRLSVNIDNSTGAESQVLMANGLGGVVWGDISSGEENQLLSIVNDTLYISEGNFVTIPDADSTNELQSLSLMGNILSLSGSGSVDLSAITDTFFVATNGLEVVSGNLGIINFDSASNGEVPSKNGSTIDWITPLTTEVDGSVTNEIQDLSLSGNTLSLSGDTTTVSLAAYLDNTDAQTLTYNSGSGNLSISGGNTVAITGVGWGLTGNTGTNPATNYLGTTDNSALVLKTNNVERVRLGSDGSIKLQNIPVVESKFVLSYDTATKVVQTMERLDDPFSSDLVLIDDFTSFPTSSTQILNSVTDATTYSQLGWNFGGNNIAGSYINQSNHPGILLMQGTVNGTLLSMSLPAMFLEAKNSTAFEFIIRTDNFSVFPTDSLYFGLYGSSSGEHITVNIKGSTMSASVKKASPSANQYATLQSISSAAWYKVKVQIALGAVNFYVNGILRATINILPDHSEGLRPFFSYICSHTNATPTRVYLDKFALYQKNTR